MHQDPGEKWLSRHDTGDGPEGFEHHGWRLILEVVSKSENHLLRQPVVLQSSFCLVKVKELSLSFASSRVVCINIYNFILTSIFSNTGREKVKEIL